MYVPIFRDGQFQQIEIDQLTDEELDVVLSNLCDAGETGWDRLRTLVRWIRKGVETGQIKRVMEWKEQPIR